MAELTDQVIDLMLRELSEKGVKPVEVYDAIGRVWPDDRATPDQIEQARTAYGNDDVEIDDNALTSRNGDSGVWVAAWVYLYNELEGELCSEK
jgi:hypothetical protein